MDIRKYDSRQEMGRAAADLGASLIRKALEEKGQAAIIVATGASQFDMLSELVKAEGIDWHKVTGFHLDEYIGLPITHPASFRKYLWERVVSCLPLPLRVFNFIDGEAEPEAECARLGELIGRHSIDVAFIGIGENGHLAFNDPPADFETTSPYLAVKLDEACRRQQMGEGWFPTLEDVPEKAISMSVKQILKSRSLICTVPDERKAEAVRNTVKGPVSNMVPASILQEHGGTVLFLDRAAAGLL